MGGKVERLVSQRDCPTHPERKRAVGGRSPAASSGADLASSRDLRCGQSHGPRGEASRNLSIACRTHRCYSVRPRSLHAGHASRIEGRCTHDARSQRTSAYHTTATIGTVGAAAARLTRAQPPPGSLPPRSHATSSSWEPQVEPTERPEAESQQHHQHQGRPATHIPRRIFHDFCTHEFLNSSPQALQSAPRLRVDALPIRSAVRLSPPLAETETPRRPGNRPRPSPHPPLGARTPLFDATLWYTTRHAPRPRRGFPRLAGASGPRMGAVEPPRATWFPLSLFTWVHPPLAGGGVVPTRGGYAEQSALTE